MYKYFPILFILIISSGCASNNASSHNNYYKKEKGVYQGEIRGRTYEEIAKVMDKEKSNFKYYYKAYFKTTVAKLSEIVTIEITINPNGRVIDSDVIKSDINDNTFLVKLLDMIDEIKFQEGNFHSMIVTYPINFAYP